MIETLFLQNFQPHEKLRVDFDPEITVITGPSDAGKSSILRALRWVILNQPDGDAIIKDGESGCTARLVIDGQSISRKRGGPTNQYILDAKEFVAFGRRVPEEIANFLAVSELNFQDQLDGPFWVGESAAEVSRQLNSVVDLGIIDRSLGYVAGRVRTARERVEVSRERLRVAKERKDGLQWAGEMNVDLQVVEQAEQDVQVVRTVTEVLSSTLTSIGQANSKREVARERMVDLSELNDLYEGCVSLDTETVALQGTLNSICRAGQKANLDLTGWDELQASFVEYNSMVVECSLLKNALGDVEESRSLLFRTDEKCHSSEVQLDELTGGKCPVCGKSLEVVI